MDWGTGLGSELSEEADVGNSQEFLTIKPVCAEDLWKVRSERGFGGLFAKTWGYEAKEFEL